MFVKAVVENFKSFSEPTELTMLSSSKIQGSSDNKVAVKSTNILKHAVIYGANAGGKSNLVDLFWLMKRTVVGKLPLKSAKWFCKCSEENINKHSSFEIQFTINEKFYAFGFTAVLSQRKITSEWLYELFQNGSSKCLYERAIGQTRPQLGEKIPLKKAEEAKFNTYVEDFEGNESMLFLTEMNRNKKYAEDSKLIFFKIVYEWFARNIVIIKPNTTFHTFRYYRDETTLSAIKEIVKTFDTGIEDIKLERIDFDEFKNSFPSDVFNSVIKDIRHDLEQMPPHSVGQITIRISNSLFKITQSQGDMIIETIKLHHGNAFYNFNFDEESDGTIRIFDLLDMLLDKSDDTVYVVDELERSIHPKLTEHFIELFKMIHQNHKTQLIFTTHEPFLMDQKIFRRDEVWFVERNSQNISTLYSLDKFKERYDKTLSKAYLEGRYGAIPVFSNLDLMEGK